jgi:hypothetical protein
MLHWCIAVLYFVHRGCVCGCAAVAAVAAAAAAALVPVGSFSLTVQVADWDQRAQLAGIPRALSAATTADQVSLQSAAAVADAAPKVTATEANAAAGANLGAGVDPSREAAAAAGLSREAVLQGTSGRPAGEAAAGAAASSSQQQQHQPHVAVLDLVVKSFDTHK